MLPLKIYVSTQSGRQYLLCWHDHFRSLRFFRIDRIREVELGKAEKDMGIYEDRFVPRCAFCAIPGRSARFMGPIGVIFH